MFRRWHVLGLFGVLIVVALIGGAIAVSPAWAFCLQVRDVPPEARKGALSALEQAGYLPAAEPVWAGASAGWRVPGTYRLFFSLQASEGGTDVWYVDVDVDGNGRVKRLGGARQLTQTPAGHEGAPVLTDNWLAFATQVAGLYQSVTCVPLAEWTRHEVYALALPAEQVHLNWEPVPNGGEPILSVIVKRPTEEVRLALNPLARRVEPDGAGLNYMPVTRGEMAWLPSLVSRIRELPGVGPEKIAFVENVFFTLLDRVTRLFHGRAAQAVETSTATPTEIKPTEVSPTQTQVPGTVAPTAAPTATPTPTRAATPKPEGRRLADGIVWRGSVKPDPERPYAEVEVIDIDPGLLQIKVVPGTWEPRPTTGLVGSGVIPRSDWASLVAAFNGGFAAMHGQYGLMADRKVYLPAREGVATLAIYEDGSIRIGTWGKDLTQTPDMVSYRQNCPPLIENGTITAETGKLTLWGLSVANEVYLYRSGLGVTKDGRLIYVAGKPLSAYTLARALQMAGAHYAMQLDVDEYHVAFITYDVQVNAQGGEPTVVGHKLRSDMRGFDGFFLRPFQLDFFYLLRRTERLANPVRVAPTPQAGQRAPTALPQELPGQLAFASNRDGNWDLYLMKPGQEGVRRLTEHPADDLYPAWSKDGQRLAFTSRRDGNADIYILDPSANSLQRVTKHPSEEWAPVWSPDGTLLAYQSDRNGQSDIYVCALDGTGEKRLTPMEGNHEAPSWSPDGKLFVYDSDWDVAEAVSNSINLYTMGADGSNARRIFSNAESPRWSPDGRTIAFTSRRTGYWQVFVINGDGSGFRQLTTGRFDARYPAWSPDGQWIAFAGNEEGHWELYAVPSAGGQPLRLTSGSGDSSYPAWGP